MARPIRCRRRRTHLLLTNRRATVGFRIPASNTEGTAFVVKSIDPAADVSKKVKMTLAFAVRFDAIPYPAPDAAGYTIGPTISFDSPACAPTLERSVQLGFGPENGGALALVSKSFGSDCPDAAAYAEATPTEVKIVDLLARW